MLRPTDKLALDTKNYTLPPDAVRGKMKLWFIEPKPNVFVSSVADALARKVVLQLLESCTPESGMLIVESRMKSPGYVLWEKTLTPELP